MCGLASKEKNIEDRVAVKRVFLVSEYKEILHVEWKLFCILLPIFQCGKKSQKCYIFAIFTNALNDVPLYLSRHTDN